MTEECQECGKECTEMLDDNLCPACVRYFEYGGLLNRELFEDE